MASQVPVASYMCPCKREAKSYNRHTRRRQCEDRGREGVSGGAAGPGMPRPPLEAGRGLPWSPQRGWPC